MSVRPGSIPTETLPLPTLLVGRRGVCNNRDLNRRLFSILNLAIFASMLGMGIVIPFLPIYAKTLGATGVSIGVFFASFPLAQIACMPAIGRLSDRRGRKTFIAAGLLLGGLTSFAYVVAPDMFFLTTIRFFQGLAVALILPISSALVGDLAPPDKRGELMGIFNLFLTGSIGVGPLVGGWLSDTYGMPTCFYLMGVLNCAAFAIVLLFLDERRAERGDGPQAASYRELFRRPGVRGIAVYRMVSAVQMGLWFSFLPLLAVEALHISRSRLGILMAVYMLVNSLLQVPFGRLADRSSKRRLIVLSGWLVSGAFMTILFARDFWDLLLISAVAGSMGALAQPALTALAAGEGKQGGMGAVMGVLSMALSIGMMLGPVTAGLLSDHVGLRPLFAFGAIAGGLGTLAFARLTRGNAAAA